MESSAHPDVLGEVKRWANSDFIRIQFVNQNKDFIVLYPRERRVLAHFHTGNLFAYLPTDYDLYTVFVLNNARVTEADKKAFAQLQSFAHVGVFDGTGTPIKID